MLIKQITVSEVAELMKLQSDKPLPEVLQGAKKDTSFLKTKKPGLPK